MKKYRLLMTASVTFGVSTIVMGASMVMMGVVAAQYKKTATATALLSAGPLAAIGGTYSLVKDVRFMRSIS